METNFESLLNTVSEKVKGMANTETVVGEEFILGEYTCKPVIKVGLGFGSGSGDGTNKHKGGQGLGAGGGVGIAPVGFLVARQGEINFIPAGNKGLSGFIDKMPDLMEKAMEFKKEKEGK